MSAVPVIFFGSSGVNCVFQQLSLHDVDVLHFRARSFLSVSSTYDRPALVHRAGTGLEFTGSGRARALVIGLGSGSGLAL